MKKILSLSALAVALLAACGEQSANTEQNSAEASAVVASEASQTAAKVEVNSNSKVQGTDMSKETIGGDFVATDGDGKEWKLSDQKGKVVILTFGYTNCPDVCPTELLDINDAMRILGDQAQNVVTAFVSVDPERDTPAVVGKYAKQFNKEYIGLTFTGDQDLPVLKQQYRVVSAKAAPNEDGNYIVDHTAGAYIVDKNGDVAVFEPYNTEPEQLAHDILVLLQKS